MSQVSRNREEGDFSMSLGPCYAEQVSEVLRFG